jgi:hypothetical protein
LRHPLKKFYLSPENKPSHSIHSTYFNFSDRDFEMQFPAGTEIVIGEKNIKTAGILV